jgi:hypothetical protein
MEKSDKEAKNAWPVKSILVAVVVLAFMFMFKREIGQILMRMTSFEIEHGEKGTSVKFTTPIGETLVSNTAPTPEAQAKAGGTELKVESRNAYRLSWPKNGKWTENKELAAPFGLDLYLGYHRNINQFNPNINVVVDKNAGTLKIEEYLRTNQELMRNMGWEISDSRFDEATQSGVQIVRNRNMFGGLYQIQRVILKNGTAYVATASKLEYGDSEDDALYAEMRDILNSFAVT